MPSLFSLHQDKCFLLRLRRAWVEWGFVFQIKDACVYCLQDSSLWYLLFLYSFGWINKIMVTPIPALCAFFLWGLYISALLYRVFISKELVFAFGCTNVVVTHVTDRSYCAPIWSDSRWTKKITHLMSWRTSYAIQARSQLIYHCHFLEKSPNNSPISMKLVEVDLEWFTR